MSFSNTAPEQRDVTRPDGDMAGQLRGSTDGLSVELLTGCQDRPYALGLARALVAKGLLLEVIGSDEIESPELHVTPNLRFLNLRGRLRPYETIPSKLSKLVVYYMRMMGCVARSNAKVLHILWNTKFEAFDRTLVMLYYKVCGKKIAFTAHNVNQAKRDLKDSLVNRLTLKIQYRLCDHIFVHTKKMKEELCEEFGIKGKTITVIRHPINDAFPDTDLTPAEARERVGLKEGDKVILFLGRLRPYKGIEYLLAAFQDLLASDSGYRLVVAGAPNKGDEAYLEELKKSVDAGVNLGQVVLRAEFIPDEDMEVYLKAADVLVLPYKDIFQSGVLFLAYSFGLPVVATDVGSFREEIVEGETGFICKPGDATDLSTALKKYFQSDIYKHLGSRRREIRDYANRVHSWGAVAELTRQAYVDMLAADRS